MVKLFPSVNANIQDLSTYVKKKSLKNVDVCEILSYKDKTFLGDFLLEYENFNRNNLDIIKKFIFLHFNDKDALFLSDLIDFSAKWGIKIPAKIWMSFLRKRGEDDDYVVMSTIDYLIDNNLRINSQIVRLLEEIIYDNQCSIYAQMRAAFLLFIKFSRHRDYTNVLVLCCLDDACRHLLENLLNIYCEKISEKKRSLLFNIIKMRQPLRYFVRIPKKS